MGPVHSVYRRIPGGYIVEVFDDKSDFWLEIQTIPIVWPLKTVVRRNMFTFRKHKVQVPDVNNRDEIIRARRAAHKIAVSRRERTRITVFVGNYSGTVWSRDPAKSSTGNWIN